jgi:hypothetical protein
MSKELHDYLQVTAVHLVTLACGELGARHFNVPFALFLALTYLLCMASVRITKVTDAKRQLEEEKREKQARYAIPPKEQVDKIAREHGLRTTGPFPGHACNGRFYANITYCPEHGLSTGIARMQAAVTELQKKEPLTPAREMLRDLHVPFATAPPVSAGGPGPVLLAGASLPQKEKEPDYVPAGQGDLLENLLECLTGQLPDEGKPHGHWVMNAEWLAEVKKLRTNGASGMLLYRARTRTAKWQSDGMLLGCPVTVGDEYGVPELRKGQGT